jgi:hypothetical protein
VGSLSLACGNKAERRELQEVPLGDAPIPARLYPVNNIAQEAPLIALFFVNPNMLTLVITLSKPYVRHLLGALAQLALLAYLARGVDASPFLKSGPQMATEDKNNGRNPALYCGDFPPELKERCESIAGALRMSISEFVEEILEDETRELKGSYETIMQWHAARLQARAEAKRRDMLPSPHESGKEEVRRDLEQADRGGARKALRGKVRPKA